MTVILFGNRVFADGIKLKGGPNLMTGVLIRRGKFGHRCRHIEGYVMTEAEMRKIGMMHL